jgi:hypothetical protein
MKVYLWPWLRQRVINYAIRSVVQDWRYSSVVEHVCAWNEQGAGFDPQHLKTNNQNTLSA